MKLNITLFLYLSVLSSILAQSSEWIVSYNDEPTEIISKTDIVEGYSVKTLSSELNIYLITYPKPVDRDYIYNHLGSPKHVSPNLDLELRRTPNDNRFGEQYHLDLIQAEAAWDITTGNKDGMTDYVIAMLDDGFDTNHPDITSNLWKNEAEIENDGIDNDNNGFVDDYLGLNIETNNDSHAVEDHGSQVLGVLGAQGNNSSGITGVMWDANVMIISAVTNIAEVIESMNYVYEMKKLYVETNGARGANVIVTNFSGGLRRVFPEDFPDWCATYDLLGTVGILSVTAVANESFDVDEEGDMPTLCDSPYLITVAYTNRLDELDSASAYGRVSVDLSAPGEDILSTSNGNSYIEESGSSFSSPQVTGAIGLMYNVDCEEIDQQHISNPSQLALDIKSAVLSGVDPINSLSESVSQGRLNLFNSMLELIDLCGGTALSELEVFPLVPNPMTSDDIATMSLDFATDVFSEHTLLITDAIGRHIYTQKFIPSTFSTKSILLNQVPYLNDGIYSFSIINENGISSQAAVVLNN